ncbi:hypothetical protein ABMA28_010822 [Loxostege sticticalis]|uniref:C2H2-type domain-containing protein n=1 Tax=Loxostege sticticalis TaxID=481309 RepID=A0ABD0S9K4_LOXSC
MFKATKLCWKIFTIHGRTKKVQIKVEMKEEENLPLDHLEGEFVDDDEFQAPFQEVKEEDFPLGALKMEIVSDDGGLNFIRKPSKRKVKEKTVKRKISIENNAKKVERKKEYKAITIYISKKECLAERTEMLKDPKYLNCVFKCVDCIKGFTFKASYDKHMEKHNESNGEYECDICKQRLPSEEKLNSHKRYHQVRYKCTECGLVRICQRTVVDHYTAVHCQEPCLFNCPHCSKVFNRQGPLRKHIWYAHSLKPRATCAYCGKTYVNKDGLKAHLMIQHPKEVSAVEASKRYVCQECGKPFKSPSHLAKHAMKHSPSRDYYCVECDKSFKSDAILQHHLKTASPHINYAELPLSCQHCDKRFSIRRDLNRHMNRIHLNIKPFQCDRCDKAYVNGWSLTEHKRLVHEGYKRPMKFPCKLCDKVFDRNSILKSHIRTHTGERPYQCSECPASFSQASIRATHKKLIHLKLTRDGRPKVNIK